MPSAEATVTEVVERNISALVEHRRKEEQARTFHGRLADAITHFVGSIGFIYLNLVFVISWFVINRGWTPIRVFDESFYLLGAVASVEAIFLSTFVLITQNRMARLAEKRSELDLQISLLAEHEITRLVRLVAQLGERLGVEGASDPQLDELKREVPPEAVIERIEERNERYKGTQPKTG